MAQRIAAFQDILENRRQELSNFMWVSRELNTVPAFKQEIKPSPSFHKKRVLQSAKIQDLIKKISADENVSQDKIEKQIALILDEIGFNKRLPVIRWLGLVLTKICKQVCSGIYVNEDSIFKVKQMMGNTPVIFLPSHRSYGDFILISYICFTYNIEIPAIAAGMDFHSMWGMGSILRDTGAFFMRRSFNDDSMYWETFREYVNQLVTKGDLPIEFFIEGTRSRTGKSLLPKLGLLSMILKPFFTSQVSDILIVPINISYDRVLEEKLFSFELLGVPKPKESTSGFFKSLSIVKERYGNIYVDFGDPISAKNFFNQRLDRSIHNLKPIYMQELSQQEKQLTSLLAYNVVRSQQKLCVLAAFNLIALSLTNNFSLNKNFPSISKVIEDVIWLKKLLDTFGAATNLKNVEYDVKEAVDVHKNLVQVNDDLTVRLVENAVCINNIEVTKLKGHALSQQTMTFVVPFIMLQIYVNPVLHYLISPAIVVITLKCKDGISKDVLFGHYGFLRSLLSYEFVTNETQDNLDFEDSLQHLSYLRAISNIENKYYLHDNKKVEEILLTVLQPFIFTYYVVCRILQNITKPVGEKAIIVMAQSQLETIVVQSKSFIHPYCLSIDTLSTCIAKLLHLSALTKRKIDGSAVYEPDFNTLSKIVETLEFYVKEEMRSQVKTFVGSKL